jgi:hypothetical protein
VNGLSVPFGGGVRPFKVLARLWRHPFEQAALIE